MKKKKRLKKRHIKLIIYIVLAVLLSVGSYFGLKYYWRYVNKEARAIADSKDIIYTAKKATESPEGLNVVNIKSDLTKYLKKKKNNNNNIKKIIYRVDKEEFYFEVLVSMDEDNYVFNIDKVVDNRHNAHAKINYPNIEKIHYQVGNSNNATVIRLVSEYNSRYLAIINDMHYILGSDIENISYEDGEFYYLSYNPKYSSLRETADCAEEKGNISGYNVNDYYYKYGKINFLKDYYQKLASKEFKVKDRCDELAARDVES